MRLTRLLLAGILAAGASGEVVRVEIAERAPVLGGKAFGEVGAYERLRGKAFFAVDPDAEANARVHGLKQAPRNSRGLVEFAADIDMLRPVEPERGSGMALFEVLNRGNKGLLGTFNYAVRSNDPRSAEHFGDGFLLERGYTLVWIGWQADLLDRPGTMRLHAPAAEGVVGWVRSAFTPLGPAAELPAAGAGHVPYPVLDRDDPEARLFVQRYKDGPAQPLPRESWRFTGDAAAALVGGFEPGKTYSVVYRSKDPAVAGLSGAAIRDFLSFLRYGGDVDGWPGESPAVRYAVAYGSSQSGRYLRDFVYEGFNADERGRRVFDGVWPHIAGAGRGSFFHLFAQPTRQDPYYPVAVFPFHDDATTDPATGRTDGLLRRAEQAGVVPKLVHTVTDSEYFNRSASLLHTTLDGARDAPPPESSRIYYFAGTQHGSSQPPPAESDTLAHRTNSNAYQPYMRAILVALDAWVAEGRRPPASRYPSVAQLAPLARLDYPRIPGMIPIAHQRRALRIDFGPDYLSRGALAREPKIVGDPYPAKLPQVDADGNSVGGIRAPSMAAPLAAYLGWNRLRPEIADLDESPGNSGSTLPFAWTRAQRKAARDPRPSVEERYKSREEYGGQVERAARALVADGRLLPVDAARTVDHALALWDWMKQRADASGGP